MEVFGRIDYNKIFTMVSPHERNIVIQNINTIIDFEKNEVGERKYLYWKAKHNPEGEIPTRIYLLGNGTRDDLYKKYINKYGENSIDFDEFKNYMRELIYQKIII
jgi:hypothetical protein